MLRFPSQQSSRNLNIMNPTKLLIVDDHTLVRQGLAELLRLQRDLSVIGQAKSGEEAVELVAALQPDIVLMDIEMPGRFDGVEATRRICMQHPQVKVIVLTMHTEEEYLFEAIKAGAKSYVLKDTEAPELLETIRAVHRGETRLEPSLALKMLEEFQRSSAQPPRPGADFIHLTEREKDILQMVGQGASNPQIANKLGISEKTVRNRLSIIFDKLHINNRTEAALFAVREGLSRRDPDATDS